HAARRAAEADVDPTGMQRFKQAEIFRDLIGAVMRQHDAAGADADVLRMSADMCEQHLRARMRQHRHAVMLGYPKALIPEPFSRLRKRGCLRKRVSRCSTFTDLRLVQYA